MIREGIKQKVKFTVAIFVVLIAIAFAIFTVLKYQVEGEKVVPYKIGKVIVISSASTSENIQESEEQNQGNAENTENVTASEGEQNQENQENQQSEESQQEEHYLWNEKVIQTNDLYIYIDKNADYKKNEIIKSVKIENIQILENVKLGKIQVYMPNSLDDGLYKYVSDYIVNSNLTYSGSSVDNKKTLEIGNQGGCVCISFANMGLGTYKSNEDQEIEQGASILEKMGISNDNLKFKVSFDLVIEVESKSYKTNLVFDLPVDELVGQKETHKEITDLNKIVFKRL